MLGDGGLDEFETTPQYGNVVCYFLHVPIAVIFFFV
jgi:hypothetical protein